MENEKEILIINLLHETALLPIIMQKLAENTDYDFRSYEGTGFARIMLLGDWNDTIKNWLTGYATAWYDILKGK